MGWGAPACGRPIQVLGCDAVIRLLLGHTGDTHVDYLCEKARKTAYALGCILHNRRVSVGVRRLVLLAVLRPVIEYASTVWEATEAQLKRLEEVQRRVLRRIVRLDCNVAHDVLRMELGCRSYSSWMDQRKLEYAYRLALIPAARLPSIVAAAAWPAKGPRVPPCMLRWHPSCNLVWE